MGQERGLAHDFGAFLRAIFQGWVKFTTGGSFVAVIATYLALSGPTAAAVRVCGWVVFVSALAAGIFQAWRSEYRRRRELEGIPELRLHFLPGVEPYEQDFKSEGNLDHYFRVGVTHDGPGQVEDVRVLLAAFEPRPTGFPYLHRLAVMGEPQGTTSCAIASSVEPRRFFDVLIQVRHEFIVSDSQDPTPHAVLHGVSTPMVCFATGVKTGVGRPTSLRLVAEGRNAKSAELRLGVTYSGPGFVLGLRLLHPSGA